VAKADDSSLDPEQLRAVQSAARRALDRASAWGVYPIPMPLILEAANLKIAPKSDPMRIMKYLAVKAEQAANALKSAISKVFGIYDTAEQLIHIDDSVHGSQQNFLKLHEAGHHELPTHRKLFCFFQDCEKTLDPETADLFEREANNFARFVLFQDDGYASMAADHALEIKTPIKLAGKFGASSTRRVVSLPAALALSIFSSRSHTAKRPAPAPSCAVPRPRLPISSGSAGPMKRSSRSTIRSHACCRSAERCRARRQSRSRIGTARRAKSVTHSPV
jgi:Zn-dependent peptidase ImmA (M78 family)